MLLEWWPMRLVATFGSMLVAANVAACFGETDADPSGGSPSTGGSGNGGHMPPVDCAGRPIDPGPSPETATGYLVVGYGEATPKQSLAVKAITAYEDASCAIEASGAVWCWGLVDQMAGSVAALVPMPMPEYDGVLRACQWSVSAGSAPLCTDVSAVVEPLAGNCVLAGRSLSCADRLSDDLFGIDYLASRFGYSCAVQRGEVWCWGSNVYGQLGSPSDGSVPVRVPGVEDAVKVSLAESQACALVRDGGVVCWGMWNPCAEVPCTVPGVPGEPDPLLPAYRTCRSRGSRSGRGRDLRPRARRATVVLCRRANSSGAFGAGLRRLQRRVHAGGAIETAG